MRYSPGDLSVELASFPDGDVDAAIERSHGAFAAWRGTSLDDRAKALKQAQQLIEGDKTGLARGIALEVGKPLKEAIGEVGAVVAKIDLAIEDATKYLADDSPRGMHPSIVRRRARGVAGVIGPFNFPLHLAHGAITAYLLAGNTVVFKPSPLAQGVCQRYADLMQQALPAGVFEFVQGGVEVGQRLVIDARVRSICFTGSVEAGRAIARATAGEVSKDVALELGGKNAAIVRADADLDLAAGAVAEAMCLTAGQRCNSTSRVIVDRRVESEFVDRLRSQLAGYVPGDPLSESTRLGPLVSKTALERYLQALNEPVDWIEPGGAPEQVDQKRGYYVLPAIAHVADASHRLFTEEVFAPLVVVTTSISDAAAIALANATPFGLTASVFTRDRARFLEIADQLDVGNVYLNLPTTLSPGTLPFGGLKESGNGHPGGRGFVRFASDEQVVQMRAD